MPVKVFVARDYAALIEAQIDRRIDYAVYSATAYALASVRCGCVEPLAAPTDADGAVGLRSVLVTRDARVAKPADMAERRIALGPPDSVAGSLLPLADLAAAGIANVGDRPLLSRAASASAAEAMLRAGTVDAVFGWERAGGAGAAGTPSGGTVARLEDSGISASALQVVWTSGLLRYGPHAVRGDLDREAKRRLVDFLTTLKARAPEVYGLVEHAHSGGFVAVTAADYETATALVRATAAGRHGQFEQSIAETTRGLK
jgi:phosphonate transport system substrate-binding protein